MMMVMRMIKRGVRALRRLRLMGLVLLAVAVSLALAVMTMMMKTMTSMVTLGLLGLRSSGFRVAELRRRGRLSLALPNLGRCLTVAVCISCGRDARLLPMKMNLELVQGSMLLARLAAVV
jgi:hypothetical protein